MQADGLRVGNAREVDSLRDVFNTSLMPQVEQVGSDLYVNLYALYPKEVAVSGLFLWFGVARIATISLGRRG